MNSGNKLSTLIPVALCLLMLIFDGNSAIEGAKSGIEVCLQTVLPSLFPFLFLSSILTGSLSTANHSRNSAICKLYGIPKGTQGILLTGLLSGYPVGAKCVGDAVARSQLSATDAERMLVFCNATGPAFLFGLAGSVFTQRWIPWCLWGIHILSGLYIARLSKSTTQSIVRENPTVARSLSQELRQSIRVMGEICGWIILMRTVITVAQKLCLWYLPESLLILFSGILEISNGCISLTEIGNTGLRFVLCAVFLNFGGLCVALQTQSVTTGIKQRYYLPGKLLQALFGFMIAYSIQHFAFPSEDQIHLPFTFHLLLIFLSALSIYSRIRLKKSCGILDGISV